MRFALPPKFDSMRYAIARSHNRRVVVLLAIIIPFLVIGTIFTKSNGPAWLLGAIWILTLLAYIFGFYYLNRLDKEQSVKLGLVCPLCGAGLYCVTLDRLFIRGECPHCGQFIIEKLNERVA
jgi:hypothetical protein